MAMSSLVQRQSERQGIFFVALSPFKRGDGGVKLRLYLVEIEQGYILSPQPPHL